MTNISGATRLYAILADPITQVKTPQGLNRIMQERGVDGAMIPMHVSSSGLATALAGLRMTKNFHGCIVTVPHKMAVLPLCDEVSETARRIGAANAVRRESDGRLVAHMLDGQGFVEGLRISGFDPKGARVYMAGAGGAANAIAFALAEAGAASLRIHNRTSMKAQDLRERLARSFPDFPVTFGTDDPEACSLVINATSLGMADGDPLPLNADKLKPDSLVAEIIMQPEITVLLAKARALGCKIQLGRRMLEGQLELMARFLGMTA